MGNVWNEGWISSVELAGAILVMAGIGDVVDRAVFANSLEDGLRIFEEEYPLRTWHETPRVVPIRKLLAAGRYDAIPVAPTGTAFQTSVWSALRAIPSGVTRTYKEVATSIGRPDAARAVARACAANPVALIIPCHRVVLASGGRGGYAWGAALKERLLGGEGLGN